MGIQLNHISGLTLAAASRRRRRGSGRAEPRDPAKPFHEAMDELTYNLLWDPLSTRVSPSGQASVCLDIC
jgi:hypothetical protein